MSIKNKVICIIPARGGSKSIPKKNIKLINKKPLIFYTIETAIKSKIFDFILVSSDSNEILNKCKIYKDVVTILRPKSMSKDNSKTEEALIHACQKIKCKYSFTPDIVFTLEPTSPLRSIKTIKNALKIYNDNNADSVIGVTETKDCIGSIKNGRFFHLQKNQPRRRQERETFYVENSIIYATSYKMLNKKKSILGDRLYPIIVSKVESFDINDKEDFYIAESLLLRKKLL